eukprot:3789800-Pyramimonas_sp.AAC.1
MARVGVCCAWRAEDLPARAACPDALPKRGAAGCEVKPLSPYVANVLRAADARETLSSRSLGPRCALS